MTHPFYPCTQLLKTTILCISHPHRPFTYRTSMGLILDVRMSSRPFIIWSLSCSMRLDLSSLFGPHCIDHLSQITLPFMILCHDLSILQPFYDIPFTDHYCVYLHCTTGFWVSAWFWVFHSCRSSRFYPWCVGSVFNHFLSIWAVSYTHLTLPTKA